ncbi:hypothetical protein D3C76_1416830 [compost metagenome]
MYCCTRRFIQHEDMIVLIQNSVSQRRHFMQMRRNSLFFTFGDTHWRNTNFIARFQFVLRFDAFFVHPHLALTQDAINHTFWHAFQLSAQKVVDSLPRFVISDSNHFYGWSLCFHGWRF